jgi:hypothetical protein
MWISPDRAQPPWRFALAPVPPRTTWPPPTLRHDHFQPPCVIGTKVFAAARDGGVYVFDVARVTGN